MRTTLVATSIGLLLFAGAVGCRTRAIGSPLTTSVPPDLSGEEVEIAIVALLAAPFEIRADVDTRARVLANPLGAVLWEHFRRKRHPMRGWFLESWETGSVHAAYRHRLHYLQIALETSAESVTFRIVTSRRLRQSEKRIHKNAKTWIERLERSVAEALALASEKKRRLDRNPAATSPSAR